MAMTGSAALAYFTLELARAAGHVGIPAPRAEGIKLEERLPGASALVVAYVVPIAPCPPGFECEPVTVHVVWWALWSKNKKTLRCIARHEVSHIFLGHGHGALNESQRSFMELEVKFFQRATWNEDSRCGLR